MSRTPEVKCELGLTELAVPVVGFEEWQIGLLAPLPEQLSALGASDDELAAIDRRACQRHA